MSASTWEASTSIKGNLHGLLTPLLGFAEKCQTLWWATFPEGFEAPEAAHFGEPKPQSKLVHLQAQDVAVQFLTAFLTKQYRKLLEPKLQEETTVHK